MNMDEDEYDTTEYDISGLNDVDFLIDDKINKINELTSNENWNDAFKAKT